MKRKKFISRSFSAIEIHFLQYGLKIISQISIFELVVKL